MIIDAHTHGLNGKHLDSIIRAGGNWVQETLSHIQKGSKGDQKRPQLLDVSYRVELLDQYGFDFQVVTPWPVDINLYPGDATTRLEIARRINDNMASVREDSRGRLIPIGIIPLNDFNTESSKEVERAIKALGLKGINVITNIMGKALDSPEFEPFWAQAAEMDFPVYVHPQGPYGTKDRSYEAQYDLIHNFGWPFETTLALSRMVFSGIMDRYPNLKVVSHHLGGGLVPFFMGRTEETYEISRQVNRLGRQLPKPLFDYFSRFYYDTAVGGSVPAIRCAYEVFGSDHLVFATDAPNGPEAGQLRLRTYPDVIRSLKLLPAHEEKIMSGNIIRLFKGLTS